MVSLISCLPTHFWLEGMAAEIREVFSAWSPVEGIDERVKWIRIHARVSHVKSPM